MSFRKLVPSKQGYWLPLNGQKMHRHFAKYYVPHLCSTEEESHTSLEQTSKDNRIYLTVVQTRPN